MKEQIKAPEKELSNEETANLPDAEFKTLVIKMLTELTELGHKMKGQMKATQSEIKQNVQGTNTDTVSYTHLTLPTIVEWCRSRWSPYH